jgi:hypothetical protein
MIGFFWLSIDDKARQPYPLSHLVVPILNLLSHNWLVVKVQTSRDEGVRVIELCRQQKMGRTYELCVMIIILGACDNEARQPLPRPHFILPIPNLLLPIWPVVKVQMSRDEGVRVIELGHQQKMGRA